MKKTSSILTLFTVIGVCVTGLLSFRAGRKLKDENADLKDLNNLKTVGPTVAPAVVAGIATAACAVTAHKIDVKTAMIASGSALASIATLKHYEAEVKELVGPAKYDEFKKKVAKKIEQNAPFAKPKSAVDEIKRDDRGEELLNFMLDLGGTDGKPVKFTSTWYKVLTAEAKCQYRIQDPEYGEATIADFKDALELEPEGDDQWDGWDAESTANFVNASYIMFKHTKIKTVDGVTCYVITTEDTPPIFLYDSYRRPYKSNNQLLKAWQEGVLTIEEASRKDQ